MDRFETMRAFVRVVEAGSFTKAAATLHMSRTTVTQLVQQLEARLQLKLLHRTTRKVNVTEDGALYYERLVQLLDQIDDVENGLPGASARPQGRLRIDVPSPLATLILMPALPQFHAKFPDIQLEMGASDRKVDLIEDRVDCVVRGGEISDQSLAVRQVGQLVLGVYAAPSYLDRHGIPVDPEELQGPQHRVVRYRWTRRGYFPFSMRRGPEHITIDGHHVVATDDGNAYLAAGVAGMGILWLPDYMALAQVKSGALVRLFPDWSLEPMPLYIAYPENRHVSKKLRVFIDWVIELMEHHAPVRSRIPAAD